MLLLFFCLNLAVSTLNAWSVGLSWAEARHVGGLVRFMTWMVATMASVGFTWCLLVMVGLVVGETRHLPPEYMQGFFDLGYVVLIIPALGSGLALTLYSWAETWRERTFASGARAAWNTVAQVYNTYEALDVLPGAFGHLGELFEDEDSAKVVALALMMTLVVLSAAGGILIAAAIIRATVRSRATSTLLQAARG